MHHFCKKIGAVLLAAVLTLSSVSVLAYAVADAVAETRNIALLGEINDGIADLAESVLYDSAAADDVKQENAEKLLSDYQTQGLVRDVKFCEDTGLYTFTYFNGYLGAIETRDPDPTLTEGDDDLTDDDLPDSGLAFTNDSLSADLEAGYGTRSNMNGMDEALILLSPDQKKDSAAYLESVYSNIKRKWDKRGLKTDLDTYVTVRDIKNIDAKYDFVCFSGHGWVFDGGLPYMVLREKVTTDNLSEYESDLHLKRIFLFNGEVYAVFPSLISDTYSSDHFANTHIFAECCAFLGRKGNYNYAFAHAFISAGATAVFGFHNSVKQVYSRNCLKFFVERLLIGEDAQTAFEQTTRMYGVNDEEWHRDIWLFPTGRPSEDYATPKLVQDTEKPTGKIASTNKVAYSQTVTLRLSDDTRAAGCYWGKNEDYSRNPYFSANGAEIKRTVSAPGTYYLTVKDISGKLSKTVSATFCLTTLKPCGGCVSSPYVLTMQYFLFIPPTPTRGGYTFNGWYTAPSGGTKLSKILFVKENRILYAQWSPAQYTVTFDPNGGETCSFTSKKVTYGLDYGELPVATRKGYTHSGWYTDAEHGTKITESYHVTKQEDHTLYARWTAQTCNVTFDPTGGTCSVQSKTVTYGSTYGVLPLEKNLSRTGYSFLGWYTEPENGVEISVNSIVNRTEDHTLYAHWEAETLPGDADGDGSFNLRDVAALSRYVAGGWNVTVNVSAADINADGVVNLRDIALLRRMLAALPDQQ